MLDLLATGYPSIDHILPATRSPAAGETALIKALVDFNTATFGGCGANVAVGLARLGWHSGVAMVLGEDAAGARYLGYLTSRGIDCSAVTQLAGQRTSCSYLFRNPDGDYQNFFYPGASDAWGGGELRLPAARWGLVTVGYAPYNQAFAAVLAAQGVPLVWQLKADILAYPRAALEHFARASRIVFCNRVEAAYLQQTLGLNELRDLFQTGVEIIALTLGAQGSRVFTPDHEYAIPAASCRVVDTTGAGDAYTAGFMAGILRGDNPQRCGQLGAAAAAFALEAIGCQTNLPDWAQLEARWAVNEW